MELRVLRYFLAVAREESITNAALSLHLSQPTLSRQLMELEEEIGKKLFIRGNRKITLTDDGMLLRKRAEEILDLVEKTENELSVSDDNISGDVYIGGGESQAIHIISKSIKTLKEKYPNINFHFYSGNAEDVCEKVDKGLMDFGIVIEPCNIRKYDYVRLPTYDTWGILMRKDDELAQKETIAPKDLENVPLLGSHQKLISNEIINYFGTSYEKLNIVSTYNLIYNASILVEDGIGVALTLDKLINTTGDSLLCFRPLEPTLTSNLNIIWKKHQIFSKAADVFMKQLKLDIKSVKS